MKNSRPCMLMILDGWGIREDEAANAVAIARTPNLDDLLNSYPSTQLQCSGEAVGLPKGIMGNSEVGHLNIGAGRIVFQDLLRIDKSIRDRSFFSNKILKDTVEKVKAVRGTLHLIGLVSDGGVHSQLAHLFSLIDMAVDDGVEKVRIHAVLDGRDTSPHSGAVYVEQLQEYLAGKNGAVVASVVGRYWAMDRDKRWDRVEKAYRLFVNGEGERHADPVSAIRQSYESNVTDEFLAPVVITDSHEQPVGTVEDGDGIIFFNFRADRAREVTRAFTDVNFEGFERPNKIQLSVYTCMTLYDESFDLPVAYPPVHLDNILGEVASRNGLTQLRIAETEKYAHVTYFFNGGEEQPFEGEDRCLIPSPRDVPTYDYKPEMSAPQVTAEVIERIRSDSYDLIVLNFANMDMVGHTGIIPAAVKACETVDRCVGEIVREIQKKNGAILITADHGNSETMADDDGNVHTAHTTNPVRLVLVDESRSSSILNPGKLGDIAPTILDIMGLEKPVEMTGVSLLAAEK